MTVAAIRRLPAGMSAHAQGVVCGIGYAEGGALSRELGAVETICWALLLSLPARVRR